MIRLTKTGWTLLGVAFVLYMASMTSQSGLLLFPIGVLLGCYIVNFFSARKIVMNLQVEPPANTHLSEGQSLSQPWKITNAMPAPAGFIRIHSPAGPLLRIGGLRPYETASLAPGLRFNRRGVFRNEEARVFSFYPFGLIRAGRRQSLSGEVVVYPAIYETAPPRAAGYDAMVGGKYKGGRRSNSGSQFSGVRPAQPGDPLKHIHWKSSSKGQGLMTKSFDEELSGRVAFIMDCGQSGDPKILDDCARAAGSLMFAALDEGHHVEWVELAGMNRMIVPPFSDGHEILDTLARIELTGDCLQPDRLRAATDLVSRKSSIVLLLTETNDAVAQFVSGLAGRGRRVSVYLPEKGVSTAALGGIPIFTYSEQEIGSPA